MPSLALPALRYRRAPIDYKHIELIKTGDLTPAKWMPKRFCGFEPPHVVVLMRSRPDQFAITSADWHIVTDFYDNCNIFDMLPPTRFPSVANLKDPITGQSWDEMDHGSTSTEPEMELFEDTPPASPYPRNHKGPSAMSVAGSEGDTPPGSPRPRSHKGPSAMNTAGSEDDDWCRVA